MCAQKLKYKHGRAYWLLFTMIQYVLKAIFKILYRVSVTGLHKVPRKGKYILCSNHISYLDPVLVGAYIPRFTYFMAKKELFSVSFLSNLVTYLNAFPISRDNVDRKIFNTSLNILKNENVLMLFPEGTRSTDGIILDGKKGVGLISLLSGAPIIPIALSGSNKIIQKPRKRIFFPKIKIIIGDIIDTGSIIRENDRKKAIGLIVDETMESIKKLYGSISRDSQAHMKVEIAKYSGYCFGVKRALNIVEKTLKKYSGSGKKVYTLGSIIHNPGVVRELSSNGLISAGDPGDIKPDSIFIVRSHGMSPKVLKSLAGKNIEIIDATCPFVKKAQAKAKKLEEQGYFVVVIGNRDHPEVIGIKGHVSGADVMVIENISEASAFLNKKKIGVVVQTTQTADKVKEIISELTCKCRELIIYNTICDTTKNRQDSTRKLSGKVDVMIIAGGRNSANTTHLADISSSENNRTYHIEGYNEINPGWFKDSEKIGISGGASTPEKDIIEIKNMIESIDS